MATLFDPAINAEILNRIGKLDPSSKPRWGKFNVEQMLAHLYCRCKLTLAKLN